MKYTMQLPENPSKKYSFSDINFSEIPDISTAIENIPEELIRAKELFDSCQEFTFTTLVEPSFVQALKEISAQAHSDPWPITKVKQVENSDDILLISNEGTKYLQIPKTEFPPGIEPEQLIGYKIEFFYDEDNNLMGLSFIKD